MTTYKFAGNGELEPERCEYRTIDTVQTNRCKWLRKAVRTKQLILRRTIALL